MYNTTNVFTAKKHRKLFQRAAYRRGIGQWRKTFDVPYEIPTLDILPTIKDAAKKGSSLWAKVKNALKRK